MKNQTKEFLSSVVVDGFTVEIHYDRFPCTVNPYEIKVFDGTQCVYVKDIDFNIYDSSYGAERIKNRIVSVVRDYVGSNAYVLKVLQDIDGNDISE